MARPSFKERWTKLVPTSVERATYVLAAAVALYLLLQYWHPISGTLWDVRDSVAAPAIWAIFGIGWAVLLLSTFLINHFELFGLTQAWFHGRTRDPGPPVLREPLFYRHVRHPLYLGFVIAFWAARTMTVGHLLFAVACTGYILIGIWFEERDLVNMFGEKYRNYRRQVSMLIPLPGRRYRHTEAEDHPPLGAKAQR